jgi:hypothetical protein
MGDKLLVGNDIKEGPGDDDVDILNYYSYDDTMELLLKHASDNVEIATNHPTEANNSEECVYAKKNHPSEELP